MGELQRDLQRLSGTTLDAQGAANVWAGTEDLDLVGALNARAGTSGLELAGALHACGGVGDPNGALGGVDSVVEQAVWAIDARFGPVDLVGSADPSPMAGTLLDPADGAVQVVSLRTNESGDGLGNNTGSFLSTPDSVVNSITGDIDIRAFCWSIDDPTNDGFVPQAIKVSKYLGGAPNVYDYLFSILTPEGDLRLSGSGLAASVTASEDLHTRKAYRITRDASSGVVEAFVEDADGSVSTLDGRSWTSLGTTTSDPGDLDDTANSELTFMIGKGIGGWCEIRDGIDGSPVVEMDIARDAPPGLASGDTFTASSGETWTLGEYCGTFAVDRPGWVVGTPGVSADGPFIVADADAIDIGTGDFTVAVVYEPVTLSDGPLDFRQVFAKLNQLTIGTTGVGWGFLDYGPLGGVGFVMNDGGGLESVFTSWDAGVRHVLVATGDRDGNLSLYVDDLTTPAATSDISDTTGTLANTDNLTSTSADPAVLYAAAMWDRVLTADEIRLLPYLMGTT